ncbi:L-cystine-binding protein FliY [bacterium HR40]|nr:L-cystine-binding protein FliY [bacterium HR40]
MKVWLVAIAATVAVAATQPALAGPVLDRVKQRGVLRVATDPAYPPQSMQKPDGSFEGFDIDVASEIANRLGVRVEFVTPAWEIITSGRWGDRWDISVGSMTPTRERAEVLDFPAIYYYTPAAFAVHESCPYQNLEELDGKVIGTCGACTYEFYLRHDLKIDAEGVPPFTYRVTPGEIRTYETDTNVFDDLRLGCGTRLDAGISALPTIREAIKAGYPMRIVGDPVFYEPLAVAIDKGDPEFAAEIARIVEALREEGTLSKLSLKWYGVDLTRVP